MQPYLLPVKDRLRHWKDFRLSLTDVDDDKEQLLKTINYWNQYPLIDRYIDPYDPVNWSTPWEFINENHFCRSSLSYMMEQTLLMSGDRRWIDNRLQLKYIDDFEINDEFIVLIIDNKYVLNYEHDEIINLNIVVKSCNIRHEYLTIEGKHSIV